MKKSNIKIFNIQYLIFCLFLVFCSLFFASPVFAAGDGYGCCRGMSGTDTCITYTDTSGNQKMCATNKGIWIPQVCSTIVICPQYVNPFKTSPSPTPSVVPSAVTAKPATPEQNPMCWTKEACQAQIIANQWTFEAKNWESPGPGGICKDMGVCIPAGKTSLEIQLPTLKTTTADLGDYIKAIYIFLISIGGIVAAVLIIKGGFEWVTSAGSPERVKSAQSSIGNSLMGLLLILGSYTLLFTINPDLVRLRLPGVYMIRQVNLVAMGEGEPCWTEGPSAKECSDLSSKGSAYKYGCLPIQTGGPLMGLAHEVAWLPVQAFGGEMLGPILSKVGGVAKNAISKFISGTWSKIKTPWLKVGEAFRSLQSLSSGASASLDKSASAFLDYAIKQEGLTKMGAVKTLTKAILIASKSNVMTAVKIGAVGGGTLYVSAEIYSALKNNAPEPGLPGICQMRKALQEGDLCDVNAPSLCASGACQEVVDLSGWVTGAKIGVCTSGKEKSICQTNSDCKNGLICRPRNGSTKSCSDGSEGTACDINSNSDCQVGLVCQDVGVTTWYSCTNPGLVELNKKCNVAGGGNCKSGLKCLNWNNAMEGYCTDDKAGSACYEDQDCQDSTYYVKCFGSLTAGGQNQVGTCKYVNYNTVGGTVLKEDAPSTIVGNLSCTGSGNCPNALCEALANNTDKYCASLTVQ